MKKGLKVMFVVNDMGVIRKWANGTIGTIVEIKHSDFYVQSVKVMIKKDDKEIIYDVEKVKIDIYGLINDEPEVVYNVINFPFLPCIATTVDKMQGMSLEKAAIVLDRKVTRPNLIYVALSRVIELSNVLLLERKLEHSDIILSKKINDFLNSIKDNLINVFYRHKIVIHKRPSARGGSSSKVLDIDENLSA